MNKKIILYTKIFLVGLTFCLGLLLRFYLFPTNNAWLGDIGRDMLAGHLIAFEGMSTQIGHHNSGINFVYPSTYYYFIAFLTYLSGSNYELIVNFLIVYQTLGIILVFFIIKNSFSYLPALIASMFFAFSERFINFSLTPISANNSIIIFLFSILFFQIYLKKRSLPLLAISSFLLVLASTFFYGAILMVPFYGLLLLVNSNSKNSKKSHFLELLAFGFCVLLLFISFYGPVVRWDNFQDKLINSGFKQLDVSRIFSSEYFTKNFTQFESMHSNLTFISIIAYFSILIFSFCRKNSRKIAVVFFLIILMLTSLYVGHRESLGHYYIYIYLLLLFVLSYGLETVLRRSKFLFVIFSVAILISGNCFGNQVQDVNNLSYYHYKKASEIITLNFPNSSVINNGDCLNLKNEDSDWESRSFWYFQKESGLFILNNFNNQIKITNRNVIYLCTLSEDYVPNIPPVFQFDLDYKKYAVFN